MDVLIWEYSELKTRKKLREKEEAKKKKDEETKNAPSGDLLALDGADNKKTGVVGGGDMMDLLDFDAKPTTVSNTPITPDLLGDILGGGAPAQKPKISF